MYLKQIDIICKIKILSYLQRPESTGGDPSLGARDDSEGSHYLITVLSKMLDLWNVVISSSVSEESPTLLPAI